MNEMRERLEALAAKQNAAVLRGVYPLPAAFVDIFLAEIAAQGLVIVPETPTLEMVEAAEAAFQAGEDDITPEDWRNIWRAMLAKARG